MAIEPDEDGTQREIDDLGFFIGLLNAARIMIVVYAVLVLVIYYVFW